MPHDIPARYIGKHVWFYPTKRGLEFTVEHLWNGSPVSGTLFTLSRRQLIAALKAVEKEKSASDAR